MLPPFQELPFTYIICCLTLFSSVVGFLNKSYFRLLIFHPALFFNERQRSYTLLTSAFVHNNWRHLIFNVVFFFFMARDIEYIFLENDYGYIPIRIICFLLFTISIILSNLLVGYKQRKNIGFTTVGLSAAVFAFLAFVTLYFPTDHLKTHRALMPLYYGYEFALAFLLITLIFYFRTSADTNYKGHFYGYIIGIFGAILLRPQCLEEIINHIRQRI